MLLGMVHLLQLLLSRLDLHCVVRHLVLQRINE